MVTKVYISPSNTATIVCPRCEKTKTVDVGQYVQMNQTVRVKSKCTCGHEWTSVLEKRRQYRKAVSFPGVYKQLEQGREVDQGIMTVVDLSLTGLKLKLNVKRNFKLDARLLVEFHLDDSRRTLMRKNVDVKNVSGLYVGVAFSRTEQQDPALGFYLMG
jgi:hypothetical protein